MTPKRLLLIAFHFPPIQGSTGVTRSLAFARYLIEFGWEVTVLSADPRAYPATRSENLQGIPPHVRVERGFAWDTKRHLSILGKYPLCLATPDRWQSWIAGGFLKARKLVREWQPSAIMSTFPIASAHQIGALVNDWCGLPWIADFRDPMAQDGYPPEPLLHRAYAAIERRVFRQASHVIVTTEGAARLYRSRYPSFDSERLVIIPNGFDDAMFPARAAAAVPGRERLLVLHSGVLYPSERDPTEFFRALAELRDAGAIHPSRVEFRLRATAHDELYAPLLRELGLEDMVSLAPAVPYADALAEMMSADACLVLQAANCNDQIPAKVYEYLYAGRPVLALTDPAGDTGRLLRGLGMTDIVPLDDRRAIKEALPGFLERVRTGSARIVEPSSVMPFSRRALTGRLAAILDAATGSRARG